MIISKLRFKNNFVININYKLKVMKHIITQSFYYSLHFRSLPNLKKKKSSERTDEIVKVLSLDKEETVKVYEALLAKEKKLLF
ncbi:MAG: hypothetical protein CM15mP32_2430 [Flavobacteriaceae bacterium]|nr:MAG: hypothetical protein CM15mP32_2430 [Flavobacteriaceae bacterium]